MGLGTSLRALGRFLDDCEDRDAVTTVAFSGTHPDTGGVAATIELVLGGDGASASSLTAGEPSVAPDGTVSVPLVTTEAVLPLDDHDVAVEPVEVAMSADGTTTIELLATVPTNGSGIPTDAATGTATDGATDAAIDAATDGATMVEEDADSVTIKLGGGGEADDADADDEPSLADRRNRDVPPFRDRELLQEVYDTCDTFSEMPAALGMDVTAETVRRYMIRQGIHEPKSYNTSSGDGDDQHDATGESDDREDAASESDDLEPQAVLADGIGLPEDVTIDTIVDAVQQSNTIYEVKQGIGIEREDALEMLKELNLLEFVAGRLATEAEREVSRDQILERLRANADPM